MHRRSQHKKEFGGALLTVIILSGVMLVVTSLAMLRFTNLSKTTEHFKLQYELTVWRKVIKERLSCVSTTRPLPQGCQNAQSQPGGGFIDLKQRSAKNEVLISVPQNAGGTMQHTKIGRFHWRAKCIYENDRFGIPVHKIVVEHALLNAKGGFAKDPLTGEELKWRDLNDGVPFDCKIKP